MFHVSSLRNKLPLDAGARLGLSLDLSERGTMRAEDAQGTPTQSHISPSILVYEGKNSSALGKALVRQQSRESICKAHRLLCHSTLGFRVIKKKKKKRRSRYPCVAPECAVGATLQLPVLTRLSINVLYLYLCTEQDIFHAPDEVFGPVLRNQS